MALDKQKILNDLGNVMNQLKCADCGCMGKLFSQGQGHGHGMASQGYGGGCRRGYGHPCCGEPYTMGEGMPAHNRPCMSYCNPPKLYADGYNFLNQNVMQPVIKEVYDDLRSLNSGNTVTNNPLGAQMGLSPGVPTLPGVCDGNPNSQMGRMNANPGGQSMTRGHPMMQNMQAHHMAGGQQMNGGQQFSGGQMSSGHQMPGSQQIGGGQTVPGGQQMSGNTTGLSSFSKMFPGVMQGEGGGLNFNPMEIAMQMNPALAKQQPGMEAAPNPMSGGMTKAADPITMQPGMNTTNVTSNQMTPSYQAQPNSSMQAMPNQQYANNPAANQPTNQVYAANTRNQLPSNFPPQGMNQNSQMGRVNANQGGQGSGYAQHAPGISKFKEMFPGVMQGLGGDVNFDPMEIAIQMNPANKQAAAMNSMEKLMTAKPLEPSFAVMKPVLNGMNAVNANFTPSQGVPAGQAQPQSDPAANQMQPNQQQYATNLQPPNQQPHAAYPATTVRQPQVYTALADSQGNEHVVQQVPNTQNYQEIPPEPMSQGYPNQVPGGRVYEREPILPVDNSRYNTIGQPIELLPTKNYHMNQPYLPQTLSPQRVPLKLRTQMNSNVKATISKTSLFARQQGRTPSRAQLQQVYNQYKGSQSYTNQNQLREPPTGQTVSDGRLNAAPPVHQKQQIPLERVGGDTAANNQVQHEATKGGHMVGQVGDVVANKPGNADLKPTKSANARNGLQDMVFTSYPQTTAWSFHGRSDQPRFRIRA